MSSAVGLFGDRVGEGGRDLPSLPVTWDDEHMAGLEMGTASASITWHAMWAQLLSFSPRPPPHGALTGAAAAA
eukprot:scaffold24613_cov51-Isochrysis_galbana.AAC.1